MKFESAAEMVAYAEKYCKESRFIEASDSDGSRYGETFDDVKKAVYSGGSELMAEEAARFIESIESHIETPLRALMPSQFGGFACVPEAIIGEPTAMRRMQSYRDEANPAKIFASVSCWSRFSPDEIKQRGYAITALAAYMAMIRPVELYTFTESSNGNNDEEWQPIVTRIETSPLALAEAAYVISSPGLYRRVRWAIRDHAYGRSDDFNVVARRLGINSSKPSEEKLKKYHEHLREKLRATEDDLIVIGMFSYDQGKFNPAQFVRERLEIYTEA